MHTIGEHLDAALTQPTDPETPVIIGDADETAPPSQGSKAPPNTPPAPPKPAENDKTGTKPIPGKAGEPDTGEWQCHTVHQGLITFRYNDREKILLPWQVIPFSEGWELLAHRYRVRFHRGVYEVGAGGHYRPARKQAGVVEYAKSSWAYVTAADSICGFTGRHFAKSKVACDRLLTIRDQLSNLEDGVNPWAVKIIDNIDLRPVLPTFWIEMDPTALRFAADTIPFVKKQDLTTGETINLVKLEDWHLLAPIPGIASETVSACERVHGDRFLLNRFYLGGTGITPDRDLIEADVTIEGQPVFFELDDLINSTVGKLTSVITPCLSSIERPQRTNDPRKPNTEQAPSSGEQHEMFSMPSLPALRNMLGDRMIAGTSVFAN